MPEWRMLGGSDLTNLYTDYTASATFTEIAAGDYEAVVDLSEMPEPFFLRFER
ncbi:MAG TPA: hypothetical protein VJ960_08760 [Oceanipulchritudo sp.]|nr:hypothetical protein [Oceanipulchritudo sp.]